VSHYTAINFTNSFLEVEERSYRLYKYLELLKYSQLFVLVYIFVLPYSTNIKLITGIGIVVVTSLFTIGVYHLVRYRNSASKFFVVAWGFLLIGALLAELQNFGALNMTYLTLHGLQIGAFFELALLSFALAYRHNNVYHALLLNKSELYKLNKDLEKKIQQRTIEVAVKNKLHSQELQNKDILLRELFHRVKNNLQIISSMLSIQSNRIENKEVQSIFNESILKIKAIAMLHEKLYRSEQLDVIEMNDYVKDLTEQLQRNFHDPDLAIRVDCDDVTLNLEWAVPMGLIINELVTNAIKRASNPDCLKEITVFMCNETEKMILQVYDNGSTIDIENITDGFGFKLLRSLVS